MKKKLWLKLGITAFWLSWPALYVYLGRSRRTRVLIVSGDKVLVLKNWLGYGGWALPGGGLHRHEDPKAGAVREVLEETGLRITTEQLQQLSAGRFNHKGFSIFAYNYAVELTEPLPPKPQRFEVAMVQWKQWRQLLNEPVANDVHILISQWFGTGQD